MTLCTNQGEREKERESTAVSILLSVSLPDPGALLGGPTKKRRTSQSPLLFLSILISAPEKSDPDIITKQTQTSTRHTQIKHTPESHYTNDRNQNTAHMP